MTSLVEPLLPFKRSGEDAEKLLTQLVILTGADRYLKKTIHSFRLGDAGGIHFLFAVYVAAHQKRPPCGGLF